MSKALISIIILAAVFAVMVSFSSTALADCSFLNWQDCLGGGGPGSGTGGQGGEVTLVDPLGGKDFDDLAKSIIDFIFTVSIPLVAILVLAGGFQMVTSAGDPTKFSNGKKTILYAIIGFAVVLLAKGVVGLIKSLVGVN